MREALGVRDECGFEDIGATRASLGSMTVMHFVRRAEAKRAVAMFVVVPIEEVVAVTAGVLFAAEAVGKAGSILECLEG